MAVVLAICFFMCSDYWSTGTRTEPKLWFKILNRNRVLAFTKTETFILHFDPHSNCWEQLTWHGNGKLSKKVTSDPTTFGSKSNRNLSQGRNQKFCRNRNRIFGSGPNSGQNRNQTKFRSITKTDIVITKVVLNIFLDTTHLSLKKNWRHTYA